MDNQYIYFRYRNKLDTLFLMQQRMTLIIDNIFLISLNFLFLGCWRKNCRRR